MKIIEFKNSFPTLWRMTESNGKVIHHKLAEISILEFKDQRALQIIVLWFAVAIGIPFSVKRLFRGNK